MAAPIALNAEQVERLYAYSLTIGSQLAERTTYTLAQAQELSQVLNTMLSTVVHAVRAITEPQGDTPGMPNDTHGQASR